MAVRPLMTNGLQFVITGSRQALTWVNVMYGEIGVLTSPPVTLTTAQAVADLMWTQYTTKINQWFGSTSSVTSVQVIDISSASGVQAFHTGSVAGALAGSPAPPQAALLIKHTVALRFRGGHSRTYITPPDGASIVSGNQWPSATVSGMQTQWNSLVSAMAGFTNSQVDTIKMGMARFVDKDVNPTPPHYLSTVDFWPWLSSTVEPVVATQRRRTGR